MLIIYRRSRSCFGVGLAATVTCIALLYGCASPPKIDIDAALKAPATRIKVLVDEEPSLLYPTNPLVGTGTAVVQGTTWGLASCGSVFVIVPLCMAVTPIATIAGVTEGLSQISMPETARAFRTVIERDSEKLVSRTGPMLAQAIIQLGNEQTPYLFSTDAETPTSTSSVANDKMPTLTLIVSLRAVGLYKTTWGVVFRLSGAWNFENEPSRLLKYDVDPHENSYWLEGDPTSRINTAWENAVNGSAIKVVNDIKARQIGAASE